MYDRDVFFGAVRDELFNGALSQQQVDGQNVILGLWDWGATGSPMTDPRWLAYALSTVYHETAQGMWPNTEMGSQSYLQGKDYYPYIGRGLVHLTWEDNYRNASAALGLVGARDLVEHPEMALDSLVASRIMFRGMSEGWFTGKKLGQYFNDTTDDAKNARQIINGNDQDELIAGYHRKFLDALNAAEIDEPGVAAAGLVVVNIQAAPGIEVALQVNGEQVT